MARHLRTAPWPLILIAIFFILTTGPVKGSLVLASEIATPPGKGTEQDPYRIGSADDLRWIHAALTNDSLAGYFFRQIQDIDLADSPGWTPIGSQSSQAFAGTYDGQGFVIRHLQLTAAGVDGSGLFSVNQGTIRRLGVVDVDITGVALSGAGPILYVGALAGLNRGTIEQCYTTGRIASEARVVGGLVGLQTERNEDEASPIQPVIENSYSAVNISGSDHYYGGLVGSLHAGSILSSYASGAVDGLAGNTDWFDLFGGLAGYTYADTRLRDVFSTGLINEGRLDSRKGGLVGYNYSQIEAARTCSATAIGTDFAAAPANLLQMGLPLNHFQQMDSFADDGWSNVDAWDFTTIWQLDAAENHGLPSLRKPSIVTEQPPDESEPTETEPIETEPSDPIEPPIETVPTEPTEPAEPPIETELTGETEATEPTEPITTVDGPAESTAPDTTEDATVLVANQPAGAAQAPVVPISVDTTPAEISAISRETAHSQPWTGDHWPGFIWIAGLFLLAPLPFLIRRVKT